MGGCNEIDEEPFFVAERSSNLGHATPAFRPPGGAPKHSMREGR